jgi:hypothetical protein
VTQEDQVTQTVLPREMMSAAIQKQTLLSTKLNYARPSKSWDHVPMRTSVGLRMGDESWLDCHQAMPAKVVNAMASGRMDAAPMEFDASLGMQKSSGRIQPYCLGLKLLAHKWLLGTQN